MSDAIVRLLLNTSGFDSNLQRSKGRMRDFSNQGSSTGNVLKLLGGNLAKLTGGLTAAGAALKVATDTFKTSESNIDAWGRTMESAKGVYEGFLNSLNTGDISGFLNNINQIISAAEDAYNALDDLKTYQAFNQVNAAKAKAGYAEALDAYKLKPTKENKEALAKANAEVIKNLKEESKKQGEAYNTALKELFSKRGLTGKELTEAVKIFREGSSADYYKAKEQYKEYGWVDSFKKGYLGTLDTFRGRNVTTVNGQGVWLDKYGKYEQTMSEAENKAFKIARALNEVNDTEIDEVQKLGAQYQALSEAIATQNRQFNRMAGNNGKTSTTTTKTTKTPEPVYDENARTVKAMSDNVAILTKQLKELDTTSEKYRDTLIKVDEWQSKLTRQKVRDEDTLRWSKGDMGRGIRLSPEMPKALTPEEAQKLEKVKVPSARNANAKADDKEQMGAVKDIVAGVDGIVSSLETLGVDVPSGMKKGLKMIQTVITILEAVKAIQSAVQILTTGRDSVYQAAVVSELGIISAATVTTAGLQAVKSVPIIGWLLKQGGVVHAAGGVVMGQNYIDRVPASLSSGEMVLNPAQQTKLFKMANEGGGGGAQSQPYVNAETIVLGIQNWAKRRGKGSELMFTQR
jgi:F0F1-type ATP synthase membrane subunit b/b'